MTTNNNLMIYGYGNTGPGASIVPQQNAYQPQQFSLSFKNGKPLVNTGGTITYENGNGGLTPFVNKQLSKQDKERLQKIMGGSLISRNERSSSPKSTHDAVNSYFIHRNGNNLQQNGNRVSEEEN